MLKSAVIYLCAAMVFISSGCQSRMKNHEGARGAYFWKTVYKLDDSERRFLADHNVERLYVRFFDVVYKVTDTDDDDARIVPNATIQFVDTINVKHVVPTVYIENFAMLFMKGNEAYWAGLIVKRIANMCSYNEIRGVDEIQLDCDWSESTRDAFFSLCRETKKAIAAAGKDWLLSSTVRVHQLLQECPPADCGVLMVYNTGNFRDIDEDNSIIAADDVKPYLKGLKKYKLPLDFAYPIFSWSLVFDDHCFYFIDRKLDLHDTTLFESVDDGRLYRVKKSFRAGGHFISEEDTRVRAEWGDMDEITSIKSLIGADTLSSCIVFDIDSININSYSYDEIESIYK